MSVVYTPRGILSRNYGSLLQRFSIRCEYMHQRGQQGMKRNEWVSGLDL
jgi:hypothetical protein